MASSLVLLSVLALLGWSARSSRLARRADLERAAQEDGVAFLPSVAAVLRDAKAQLEGSQRSRVELERTAVALESLEAAIPRHEPASREALRAEIEATRGALCLEVARSHRREANYARAREWLERGLANRGREGPDTKEVDATFELRLELAGVRADEEAPQVEAFEALLTERPSSLGARLGLAEALALTGAHERALACLRAEIERGQRDARLFVLAGRLQLALGRPRAARRNFEAALDLDEGSFASYLGLGRAEAALGRLETAEEHLTEAIDILPSLPDGYLWRAHIHFQGGSVAKAIRDYEVALSRSAGCHEARLGLARALAWNLDDAGAESNYRALLSDPGATRLWASARAGLAWIELVRADPICCALEVSPPRAREACRGLVEARLRSARAGLEEVLAADPTHADALVAHARLELRAGDLQAHRALRARLAPVTSRTRPTLRSLLPEPRPEARRPADDEGEPLTEPDRPLGQRGLAELHALQGLALLREGRPDEARAPLAQALHLDPDSASAAFGDWLARGRRGIRPRATYGPFFLRGLRHAQQARASKVAADYWRAQRAFAVALARNPLDAQIRVERALLLRDWGRLDEAVEEAELAVGADPALREGYELLGFLFAQDLPPAGAPRSSFKHVRDPARGSAEFDRAIRLADPGAGLRARRGRALARIEIPDRGEREAARRDLAAALERLPDDLADAQLREACAAADVLARLVEVLGASPVAARRRAARLRAILRERVSAEIRAGSAANGRSDLGSALRSFERALALDPTSSEAYRGRGRVYLRMGNFVPGVLDMSRALEHDPGLLQEVEAIALPRHGVDDRAIEVMGVILKDHPNESCALFLRGLLFVWRALKTPLSDGEHQTALADLNRCLESNPDHVAALLYRGLLRYERGRREPRAEVRATLLDQAEQDLKRALALRPAPRIWLALGQIAGQRAGDPELGPAEREANVERALVALERAAAEGAYVDPQDPACTALRKLPRFQQLAAGK